MMVARFRRPRDVLRWLPLFFFGVLLAARAGMPRVLIFDEVHYVPAAKGLVTLASNLNIEHPPIAKYLMGLGWLVFSKWLDLASEPAIFRLIGIAFGLWALWGVRTWMRELGFSELAAQAALCLTGFNFLWFVQAKTAMLDIYFVAFAVWGCLEIFRSQERKYRRRYFWGWALLGLAMGSKWSALPFCLVAFVLDRRSLFVRLGGTCLSILVYFLSFIPLSWISDPQQAVPISQIVQYHRRILDGFASISHVTHVYQSKWWQWPTLLRPIWYTFEQTPVGGGEISIWAGGNPVLFWSALPLVIYVGWIALGAKDRTARVLSLLYWIPLLFWAIAPRKVQMFYYYLGPSLFVGPIVVWAHERARRHTGRFQSQLAKTRGWALWGYVLLCGAAFLYFLPIMDGRVLPEDRFQIYMWLKSWI